MSGPLVSHDVMQKQSKATPLDLISCLLLTNTVKAYPGIPEHKGGQYSPAV